jgi:hypothetical protein
MKRAAFDDSRDWHTPTSKECGLSRRIW